MTPKPLINTLSGAIAARLNCIQSANVEWQDKQEDRIKAIADLLPSGSGFDSGTTIDLDRSTPDRIVLHTSYHHMNDGGMYDGWTDHDVIVTPSFIGGFDVRVTGRDRRDTKDYIAETFQYALSVDVDL